MTAPHAVITVEDGVYGLTSFCSIATPAVAGASVSVTEAIKLTIEQVRSLEPHLLAIVGTVVEVAAAAHAFHQAFPETVINTYPTDRIDGALATIADKVVRDAATLAAEHVTHELAHFRAARDAGLTVEGAASVDGVRTGLARRVLVHDDLSGSLPAEAARPADHLIAQATLHGVPITMIPEVPEERGPIGGLGVVLDAEGTNLASRTVSSIDSRTRRLRRYENGRSLPKLKGRRTMSETAQGRLLVGGTLGDRMRNPFDDRLAQGVLSTIDAVDSRNSGSVTMAPTVDRDTPPRNSAGEGFAPRCFVAAESYQQRAVRLRQEAATIGASLAPLGVAMRRRAAELELASVAYRLIGEGTDGRMMGPLGPEHGLGPEGPI